MDRSPYLRAGAAVGLTALVGSAGTDVRSAWYRRLPKPRWQPPGPAFGIAWTTLYALLAVAGGRVLDRSGDPAYRRAFAGNLALNAAWPWTFFRARRPWPAATVAVALTASTADLARRSARVDRPAGALLVPYAGWTAFATALSTAIARRYPGA